MYFKVYFSFLINLYTQRGGLNSRPRSRLVCSSDGQPGTPNVYFVVKSWELLVHGSKSVVQSTRATKETGEGGMKGGHHWCRVLTSRKAIDFPHSTGTYPWDRLHIAKQEESGWAASLAFLLR